MDDEDALKLKTMCNSARVYCQLGRHKEAEQLYKQVLAVREKKLGRDHSDTLVAMNNLATVYISQKRYDEAAELFKDILVRVELSPQKTEKAVYPSLAHPSSALNRRSLSNGSLYADLTPRFDYDHSEDSVSSAVRICTDKALPLTLLINAKTSAARSPSVNEATGTSVLTIDQSTRPFGKRSLDPESPHVHEHISKHRKRD